MPRAKKKERSLDLYKHIAALNSVEECCRFFDDLCAVTELRAMEQRFDVAKMLHAGKVYTTILSETGASSATVSRVNRVLNYGTGALEEVMDRVSQEEEASGQETEDDETIRRTE
ncbi:MAG: YerC/YecD family TrpR-related protein [Clostridiales bacterium]|nr:YerC/YecD family TrpR-related protein [Clostridiales bacterium]